MATPFDLTFFEKIGAQAQEYFFQQVLSWTMAVQVVIIVGAILFARHVTRGMNAWFTRLQAQYSSVPELCAELPLLMTFKRVINSFLAFIVVWIAYGIAEHFHWPRDGLYSAGVILMALTLVRLFTGEMTNRFWARILAGLIWLWAILYIFHVIEPWLTLLSHIDFKLGQVRLSLLQISRALPFFLLLYWLAKNLAIIWRFWLAVGSGLSAAMQILMSRLGSIFLYSAAVILVLLLGSKNRLIFWGRGPVVTDSCPLTQTPTPNPLRGVGRGARGESGGPTAPRPSPRVHLFPALSNNIPGTRSHGFRPVQRRPGVGAGFWAAKDLCQPGERLYPPGG
jgi:hypothetical protein